MDHLLTSRVHTQVPSVAKFDLFEFTVCLLHYLLRPPLIFCLATPDVIHQAKFALDVKEKVLPLYEQVFDIEYPLPKLDTLVVSVPFLL